MDTEIIENNIKILKEEWISELVLGLKDIEPIVKNEFELKGIVGLISNPFIDLGAVTYLRSMRKTALRQLNIAIACAREAMEIGVDEAVEKYFDKFARLDEIYSAANKSHPKFKDIELSLRKEFELRIVDSIRLMQVKPTDGIPEIKSISDIYKIAYDDDIVEAVEIQKEQILLVAERIEIVRKHESLLHIPFGLRGKIFRIVEKGYDYTENKYVRLMERYFQSPYPHDSAIFNK